MFYYVFLVTYLFYVLPGYTCEMPLVPQEDTIQALRTSFLLEVEKDIKMACKVDRLKSAIRIFNKPESPKRFQIYQKLTQLIDKGQIAEAEALFARMGKTFQTPWSSSLSGSSVVKASGWDYSSILKNKWGFRSFSDAGNFLEYPGKNAAAQPEFINYVPKSDLLISKNFVVRTFGSDVCKKVTSKASSCVDFLGKISGKTETFEPQYPMPISYPDDKKGVIGGRILLKDLHTKVLTDPRYQDGIRRSALRVIDRLKHPEIALNGNVFDDVKQGFIDSGVSITEAENMAWDIMAILAVSGPNIGVRLWTFKTDPINNASRVALTAIAEAMPFLDSYSLDQQNRLYSLPAKTKSTCDNGKNYHFWLTGYFARLGVKDGVDSLSAAGAAYITNIGYQVLQSGNGRSPIDVFSRSRFGSAENRTRMDLATAAAGAKFGSTGSNSDIDELFLSGIRQSSNDKSLNGFLGKAIFVSPSTAVDRWERIYSPWEIFNQAGQK